VASVRRRRERVQVELAEQEAPLLVDLVAQTISLLDPDVLGTSAPAHDVDPLERLLDLPTGPVAPPEDPALRRLLPDAYRDDDDAAEEFRRLTNRDLRDTKATALRRVVADVTAAQARRSGGVAIDLADDAATAWLHALADVRLALGTRLDVTEDLDLGRELSTLSPEDERHAGLALYDWLTWLQDAVVRAVSG
jgi:hypothetical protein